MANLLDIGVSALINIIGAFLFLLAFAVLRIQPINDKVYFPKWYIKGARSSPIRTGKFVGKFVNLNFKTYITSLNWMSQALQMTESDIIDHAGLDSAVFLRIYILGLKIFGPVGVMAFVILIPINVSESTLSFLSKELVVSHIDKLSISNIRPKSMKFFAHISMEYLFTFWTCYMLYKEFEVVASMRSNFLASQDRRAEQYTVLVKNVPHVSGCTVSSSVDNFFQKVYPEHYLCHQPVYNVNQFSKLVRKRERLQNLLDYSQLKRKRHPDKKGPTKKKGFCGLWGERVDSIDYYKKQIEKFDKELTMERERILKDPKSVTPAAFVCFNSRWCAALCAQTKQSKKSTLWLTDSAPEPRDVYWKNLSIPFISRCMRKLVVSLLVFLLIFFYMIPVAFVQSLANLENLEDVAPFIRPVAKLEFVKSFLQGFLPGLALKIFLYILPRVMVILSKFEGHVSVSELERKAAAKYYYFMLVNVFFGSLVTGTAFEQLRAFLHESPAKIPRTVGVTIPMQASFFITYIMVDGWAGTASEILRFMPMAIFHFKKMFMVKTERDKEKLTRPGKINFPEAIPSLLLYFLLGIVYAVVTPIFVPFILIFFGFAYVVYRHQIINVYNQRYESAAAFWPHVHTRIIAGLLISQLLLMGLLSTKKAASSTPFLVVLPILTLAFHKYCQHRFKPVFGKYSLEEAMEKDAQDLGVPDLNLESYLSDAYVHSFEEAHLVEVQADEHQTHHITTHPASEPDDMDSDQGDEIHNIQHY